MTNIDSTTNRSAKVSLVSPNGDTHFIYDLREKYLDTIKGKMFLYTGALCLLNILLFLTYHGEYNQDTAAGIVGFHILSVTIWFAAVGTILYRMYLLDKCLFSILRDDTNEKVKVIRSVTTHLQSRTYYFSTFMFTLTFIMYFTIGWPFSGLLCMLASVTLATFMLHFTEFRKNIPYAHEIELLEAQGARWASSIESGDEQRADEKQV